MGGCSGPAVLLRVSVRYTISVLRLGRPWLARIVGRSRKFEFDRVFLEPVVDEWAAKEFGWPVCYWHVDDGIYEYRFESEEGFFCVLNGQASRLQKARYTSH
jgi:hypothetical protein